MIIKKEYVEDLKRNVWGQVVGRMIILVSTQRASLNKENAIDEQNRVVAVECSGFATD